MRNTKINNVGIKTTISFRILGYLDVIIVRDKKVFWLNVAMDHLVKMNYNSHSGQIQYGISVPK